MAGEGMDVLSYGQYYDLESYLFKTVRDRFREQGFLDAFDFFCIVIWKANRSKSKIARSLMKKGFDRLDTAVEALTSGLAKQNSDEGRFRLLFDEWGLRVPMASAILTVLYPENFTVYDVRVCDIIGDFHNLQYLASFDSVWLRYQDYMRAVMRAAPDGFTLREKDRYLWGKSFYEQLRRDIKNTFRPSRSE